MTEDQLATLTHLLQQLVTQTKSDFEDKPQLKPKPKPQPKPEPPKRILRSLRDITMDMNLDFASIPQKTLRGCGKFVKDEYIKYFNKSPLQTHSSFTCLYTKKEIKFVKPLITKYFQMNASDSDTSSISSNHTSRAC